MKNIRWLLPAAALLSGACGVGSKVVVKRSRYDGIKTVAVVEYTVPQAIEYKENPREASGGGILRQLAKQLAKGDGTRAAAAAHASFCEALGAQELGWRVLSAEEMASAPGFAALVKKAPAPEPAEAAQGGMKKALGSFMKAAKSMLTGPKPVGPGYLNHYKLVEEWKELSALTGGGGEKRYLREAAAALGVDAVLVVNDPGFSFSCVGCVGTTGSMNGAASTGSAFVASLIDADGDTVLDMREWFAINGTTAIMAMSAVNPLEHDQLFQAHGRKMAAVFGAALKKALKKS